MVLKWMLKPWANMSSLPAAEVGADLVGIEFGRGLIGDQDHDHVGPLGGFGDGGDFKAGLLRLGDGLGVGGEADFDLDAGVLEVEGVCVPLGAVADDGYLFRLDEGEVGIVIVVGRRHDFLGFPFLLARLGVDSRRTWLRRRDCRATES